jgi:hypothetical protein
MELCEECLDEIEQSGFVWDDMVLCATCYDDKLEDEEKECSGKHCSNTENLRLEKCWDKFERAVTEQLVCERCYDELTKKDCVSCSEKYIWDELKIMPACFPWGEKNDCDEWKRTYCKACIIAIPESIQRNNLSEDDLL